MRKATGKAKTVTPFFCSRYQEFELWYEGIGWDLPRTDAMMDGLENTRYADICGEDIGAMDGVGWEFIAEPICFTATRSTATDSGARVIAIAWAAPMCTEEDEMGCNLTYAVDEQYQGRSLSKLLTCLAFIACDQTHPGLTFANIESRADNQPSLALARSLGFVHYPEEDFTMPVAGGTKEVAFHCLRADMSTLRLCACLVLKEKNLHDLVALIQKARRV